MCVFNVNENVNKHEVEGEAEAGEGTTANLFNVITASDLTDCGNKLYHVRIYCDICRNEDTGKLLFCCANNLRSQSR